VTFPGPVIQTASVEIRIVDPTDPSSNTPLSNLAIDVDIAIQEALRALYVQQSPSGAWVGSGAQEQCAATGFALWAIQNQGHVPTNPMNEDILAEFVQRGLDTIFAGAVNAGTIAAVRADVPRGAIAAGVSDLNSNGRSIHPCPGGLTVWYPPPIATAAVIASLAGTRLITVGAFAGETYQNFVADVVDWIGTAQNSAPPNGPRGGWHYNGPTSFSDMSINSWYYLALEGAAAVFPPCGGPGGGGGLVIPDWIKQEAEYALIYHQTNAAGAQPFGYSSAAPLRGGPHGIATTAGGLSGLALVETEVLVPIGDIIDNEPAPLNTVAARRQAALDYLGTYWNNTTMANLLGYGNRGNFYAMWTAARALRLTATALSLPAGTNVTLTHSALDFDWETGETLTPIPQGNVPGAGDPREGYFPFLVRTQDTASGPTTRGRWNQGTYLQGYSASLETALGLLILADRVFGPKCQIACKDIEVACQGPQGAIVRYDITTSGCQDGAQIICTPPSGTLFPIGTTQVTCYVLEPCGDRRSLPCCFDVTVTDNCECLAVTNEHVDCSPDVPGEYTYSFDVTNLSGVPVRRMRLLPCDGDGDLLPDFTMTPDTFQFTPLIPDGGTTTLSVTLSGVDPDRPVCFEIWMFDERFSRCCVLKHCVELPDCCLEIVDGKLECDPADPSQYLWTFSIRNQSPFVVDRIFLWPPAGVSISPSSFILPPLPTGSVSAPLQVTISGAGPGDTVCFEISIHESRTGDCCAETICLTLPDCQPCDVPDSCAVTRVATLCQVPGTDFLEARVTLTICNNCNADPIEFQWSVDGFTDPACPNPFLSAANFSPSSGVTQPLFQGKCETIVLTIRTDFGQFPPGATACWEATVVNPLTGVAFTCRGRVRSPQPPQIKAVANPVDPVLIPRGEVGAVRFELSSVDPTLPGQVVRFVLSSSLPEESASGAISLNGLPPGEVVRGQADVPGDGRATVVAVEVRFAIHVPSSFFDVFLIVDSADGTSGDVLASAIVGSFDPRDCNGNEVSDDVDILLGISQDANRDGVPDECRGLPIGRVEPVFRRGDSNSDRIVDLSDGVKILGYLFLGADDPGCLDAADSSDDGAIDIGDAVTIFNFLFSGGREPAAPGPFVCGEDLTGDELTCFEKRPCE